MDDRVLPETRGGCRGTAPKPTKTEPPRAGPSAPEEAPSGGPGLVFRSPTPRSPPGGEARGVCKPTAGRPHRREPGRARNGTPRVLSDHSEWIQGHTLYLCNPRLNSHPDQVRNPSQSELRLHSMRSHPKSRIPCLTVCWVRARQAFPRPYPADQQASPSELPGSRHAVDR